MKEEIEIININLFAVKNKEGKWLRSRYKSSDENWVTNFSKAKTWKTEGSAKSQITWWATHRPEYGTLYLAKITTGNCILFDQTDRIEQIKHKKLISNIKTLIFSTEYKINNYIRKNILDIKQIDTWKEELSQAKKELQLLIK